MTLNEPTLSSSHPATNDDTPVEAGETSDCFLTVFGRDATAEDIYETGLDMIRRAHGIPPGEPIPEHLLEREGDE
ncbi:MAG: hypothetical protein MPJ50_11455 [Pirellulales bacterium]|nr:hypothetical protein [Pirellulales bacterium]